MNLLMLVYFTDVFIYTTAILGLISVILLWGYIIASIEKEEEVTIRRFRNMFIIAIITTILLPSKNTMYLIISQKVGNEIMSSELGTKALKLLKSKIDKELKNMEDK